MPMLDFDDQFSAFDVTPVENLFIDEYMPRASGEFIKVYIYALRQLYHPPREALDFERMATVLCMDVEDVKNAFAYWERQGLLRRVSDNPPSYKFFNLKVNLMNQQTLDDGLYRYRNFNDKVQRLFSSGRLLHESDTKYLYDWIEVYRLPESVVLILVEYLLKKRGPNVRFAGCDKIAKEWADKGILTEEAAREQVRRFEDSFILTRNVLRQLGIRLDPTPEQERMYAQWVELGFDNAAILECCKETANARTPNMGYLDSVIHSKHELGLHTVREISEYNEGYRESMVKLREVLKALNQPIPLGVRGLLEDYAKWQDMGFSHEAILLVAQALRKLNMSAPEDLGRELKALKDVGVLTPEAIGKHYDEILTYTNICDMINARLGIKRAVTPADREIVMRWSKNYSMSLDMMLLAADRAREVAGAKSAYMEGILRNWYEHDIVTPDDVSKEDGLRRARAYQTAQREAKSSAPEGQYPARSLNDVSADIMQEEGDN